MSQSDNHPDRHHFIGDISPAVVSLLKQVAEEAATKAVSKAFLVVGLDPDDPIASQTAMVYLRNIATPEAAADREWVRLMRERAEGAWGKVALSVIVVSVGGALQALWKGLVYYASQVSHG